MQRTKTRRAVLRCLTSCYAFQLCLVGGFSTAYGDWREDIGYDKLVSALGTSLPNGAGVPISLVEAVQIKYLQDGMGNFLDADGEILPPGAPISSRVETVRNFIPSLSNSQFAAAGDPLNMAVDFNEPINQSNSACGGTCLGFSSHANGQAQTFFGNTTSVAPAANQVTLYGADDYLNNTLNLSGSNSTVPDEQDFRVQNFSWIGTFTSAGENREALRRFDYAIEDNNITAVVGLGNGSGTLPELLSHSYNSIAIGRRDGNHSIGLTHLANYGVGRSKPELVVNRSSVSAATSSVSSVATFLHSADTVLGTDAANSETIKALLLAGASKDELPSWSQIDTSDEWHPLDDTFGAGEVNVYNSYLATLGGQFVGNTTTPIQVASHGWDYQSVQPGLGNELLYDFVIPTGSVAAELSIALTWNAKINSPFDSGNPIVANLALKLVDENGVTLESDSDVDNVEYLYLKDLTAGTYTLKVSSDDLASDFGLAWRTATLFETFTADFDEDGDADGIDFLAWQRGFGTLVNATRADGDTDGDGDVDADDLAFLNAALFGEATSLNSLIASVPEPAGWILVCLGLLLALGSRDVRYRSLAKS